MSTYPGVIATHYCSWGSRNFKLTHGALTAFEDLGVHPTASRSRSWPNRRRLPPNRPVKQEAESVWCRLARISRRTRSDRSPFRSNADDLFACSLQALRSHRDQSGTLRRSPMSEPKSRTIIKLQPTARAYRIIPLCTRGRSICLQQTEPIASQAVSYYCFIPRPPAPCAPPAPYGPGSAPAALAPYFPLGRLQFPFFPRRKGLVAESFWS